MAGFTDILYARFIAVSQLTALVTVDDINPVELRQQSARPAIRFSRITSQDEQVMGQRAGLRTYRYQIDTFGKEFDDVDAVVNVLKVNVFDRWTSADVQYTVIESESDYYESGPKLFRHRLDVSFVVVE